METGWSDAVAADLQALAQLAALHIPDRPVLRLTDEAEAVQVHGDRSEACPGLRSRGETDDWVDEETLPLLYGPWERAPEGAVFPVVAVERYLAGSWPALKAAVLGFFRTWPANAPVLFGDR